MIVLGIAALVITVIGVGRSVEHLAKDGYRRVPTRTYPHAFDLR